MSTFIAPVPGDVLTLPKPRPPDASCGRSNTHAATLPPRLHHARREATRQHPAGRHSRLKNRYYAKRASTTTGPSGEAGISEECPTFRRNCRRVTRYHHRPWHQTTAIGTGIGGEKKPATLNGPVFAFPKLTDSAKSTSVNGAPSSERWRCSSWRWWCSSS